MNYELTTQLEVPEDVVNDVRRRRDILVAARASVASDPEKRPLEAIDDAVRAHRESGYHNWADMLITLSSAAAPFVAEYGGVPAPYVRGDDALGYFDRAIATLTATVEHT